VLSIPVIVDGPKNKFKKFKITVKRVSFFFFKLLPFYYVFFLKGLWMFLDSTNGTGHGMMDDGIDMDRAATDGISLKDKYCLCTATHCLPRHGSGALGTTVTYQ
jgi:hypothetical protein